MKPDYKSYQIANAASEAALGYFAPSKRFANQTSERFQFSLAPSLVTQESGNEAQQNNQQAQITGTEANQYGAAQQGLQGQTGNLYSSLLQGNIPNSYTANPNLVGAYQTAYNQTAPATAFSGGAGSPQLASNYAQGLQGLLANQYNTGISNYQNALTGATSNAFSGTGTNTNNVGSQQSSSYGTGNTNSVSSQPLNLIQLMTMAPQLTSALKSLFGP